MTMTMTELVAQIRDSITRSRCVPIIGAGASVPVGGPTWEGYLRQMSSGLPVDLQDLMAANPLDAASYLRSLRERLGLPDPTISLTGPSQIHQALAAWRCPLYITTNYDTGMEDALLEFGRREVRLSDRLDDLMLPGTLAEELTADKPRFVVKLCSSSRHGNAASRQDFALLEHLDRSAAEFLVTILRCYTAVFVGCSMRDPLITYAINHAFALPVGRARHVAIVPQSFPEIHQNVLKQMGVDSLSYSRDDPSRNLAAVLAACKSAPSGPHKLILFEPGTPTKLKQLVSALRECSELGVSRVAVVTESPAVERAAFTMLAQAAHEIPFDVIPISNLGDTSAVVDLLAKKSADWNAIAAPYEYAVGHAADFVAAWGGRGRPRFHSKEAASRSRDKREFRLRLSSAPPGLAFTNIPYQKIGFLDELTHQALRKKVEAAACELKSRRIVVKPPNAAGSIGVRPLDLDDDGVDETLTDLLNIVESMPVDVETARCDVSELLVEKRIEGEEFSVESRRGSKDEPIEVLAIHWKVDIDSDATRFFERLFVTLPMESAYFQRLVAANNDLLSFLDVGAGVFHAEFRADPDGKTVYPLEVGLRPGGGMVSASVEAARGVNLFEALIRCSLLGVRQKEATFTRIVATGLVFANQRGVLPPLAVRDGPRRLSVNPDDPDSLRTWLRHRLASTTRDDALAALKRVLARRTGQTALCLDVLSAFDKGVNAGIGMLVDLQRVDMLERPGFLITEEEACYVAGFLIVSDDSLAASAAVAECVASMELCLGWLECNPEDQLASVDWRCTKLISYPDWWKALANGGFLSDIDSWALALAIDRCRDGEARSILDLGCGSARPAVRAIRDGCHYLGIDIDDRALRDARGNLARVSMEGWDVEQHDVFDDAWLQTCTKNWEIVAANLPYLPTPPGSRATDETLKVDGGSHGLRFLDRVLHIATVVEAKSIVLNTSSLCDLKNLAARIETSGFGLHRVVAALAPLESYALAVREHLQRLNNEQLNRIYSGKSEERQIIYSLELRRGSRIPVHSIFDQAEKILQPTLRGMRTIAIGTSGW